LIGMVKKVFMQTLKMQHPPTII